jgi:hypothetical protein
MSELSEQLNKLMNRMEELEKTPSELTKDSLLADLRDLYDSVKRVDVSVLPATEPEPAVEQTIETSKPIEKEVLEEPLPTPVVEPVEQKPEAATAPVQEELQEEAQPETTIENEEPPIVDKVEEKENTTPEKKPLIGKEEPENKDSNEKILAGQLSKKPLEDLRTGIPLNEKFGIIRGLFKGNASDYGDAVLKLNNAANASEMNHYLDLLEQRFDWDRDSDAYQTFSVYVERKKLTLETSDANTDK